MKALFEMLATYNVWAALRCGRETAGVHRDDSKFMSRAAANAKRNGYV
jgi:hypothetical protein